MPPLLEAICIRKQFPGEEFSVVTFARWEEGLILTAGNPKSIRKIEDLARKNVRFVNREPGSGSRGLLDKLLEKGGMDAQKVQGYDRIAFGHLAAAYCVLSRDADACLATRSAAQTFGLDFIPLRSERYDLVMRKRTADLPAVKAFLDVLQRATLRRKLEVLAGYDTTETGTLVVCSGPDTPSTVSLLPETHICIVRRSRMVSTMEEAFAMLRREKGELPRATWFISGPSRTADIELTIVIGAHGPYRTHVILVP